ncbi:MAG TPA: PEP-CTERM sorting domain-containing protein [Gemmataceae bacterium]|nr:PEP-CTERM sorting domain-containing protein [Gemmataceae bacterium]
MGRLLSCCPQLLSAVLVWAASVLFLTLPAAGAQAGVITPGGLADGAGNQAVQTAMQALVSQVHPGGTITVTGAGYSTSYTGDGHVVGPMMNGHPTSATLASGGNGFLFNDGSDRITMLFSFPIYGLSFNYEIFPDGTVPDGTHVPPSQYPDLTVTADGTVILDALGVMPGQNGTFLHSPASGAGNPELAPQLVGASGFLSLPNGATKIEFIDWPERIGINNLQIFGKQAVPTPEPSTLVMLVVGLAGLCLLVGLRSTSRRRQVRGLA